MFAKLYGNDKDQVLVVIDRGDDGPEVRIFTVPDEMGVCSIAAKFPDDDEGWGKAEAVFQHMDEETARRCAAGICKMALGT